MAVRPYTPPAADAPSVERPGPPTPPVPSAAAAATSAAATAAAVVVAATISAAADVATRSGGKRVVGEGTGSAGSAGQTPLRGIPAKTGSMGPSMRACA